MVKCGLRMSLCRINSFLLIRSGRASEMTQEDGLLLVGGANIFVHSI